MKDDDKAEGADAMGGRKCGMRSGECGVGTGHGRCAARSGDCKILRHRFCVYEFPLNNEQPRTVAREALPKRAKPLPRLKPKSSVWIASTEKTFAKSKTRINPVSPSETRAPVSGEITCT